AKAGDAKPIASAAIRASFDLLIIIFLLFRSDWRETVIAAAGKMCAAPEVLNRRTVKQTLNEWRIICLLKSRLRRHRRSLRAAAGVHDATVTVPLHGYDPAVAMPADRL